MVTPLLEFRVLPQVGLLQSKGNHTLFYRPSEFPFVVKFLSMSCASGVKVKPLVFPAGLFDAAIAARIKRWISLS